ncbi:MAG: type II toxin-antitoxin system tRNA(fMet)-specific endonuclease VapC [Polyangiales bacterium]
MNFLLDTNVCIQLLNGSSTSVAARFRATAPAQVHLCAIVKAELLYGARKSRRTHANLSHLARFFGPLSSDPFDDAAAEHYGSIRAELAAAGCVIGANDLCIAAIARSRDRVLVTHNHCEFSRIVGLRVEDWQAS